MWYTFLSKCIFAVDLSLDKDGFKVVGKIPNETNNFHNRNSNENPSLVEEFNNLPTSIRHICGNVTFPEDNGKSLMEKILQNNNIIVGASNASLKDGRATQAWILTSGYDKDLNNDLLSITGAGPVDGYNPFLSSTRAKIAGITAVSIIAQLFLKFHSSTARVTILCDNQGAISKCSSSYKSSLRYHRSPNLDLLLRKKRYF